MTTGERIRARRKERCLTLRQLGAMTSLSNGALSQHETGQHSPSLALLARIAAALGCTSASLLGDEPSAPGGYRVSLSPAAVERLEALRASGLWGVTPDDVATSLVLAALRREVTP